MTLRSPQTADAGAVAELLAELGYPAEDHWVTDRLSVLLSRSDYGIVVAEERGIVLGLGAAHVFPVLHAERPVTLITALVVAEAARGRGVGRALVGHLEEFARSQGCTRIVVTTANHRAAAHAFYERLGYTFSGRRYAKQPL